MSRDILIEALKALLLGITEGITEWLPISSTGHMILVDEFVKLNVSDKFLELFLVVIQIGSIMAVVVTFWHKLNPISRTKDETERRNTWHMWCMVVIGSIPGFWVLLWTTGSTIIFITLIPLPPCLFCTASSSLSWKRTTASALAR